LGWTLVSVLLLGLSYFSPVRHCSGCAHGECLYIILWIHSKSNPWLYPGFFWFFVLANSETWWGFRTSM
jgi:hypothetical protein